VTRTSRRCTPGSSRRPSGPEPREATAAVSHYRASAVCGCVTVLALVALVPINGRSQDAEPGRRVFEEWCAPCHAPGPRHPGTQALDVLYRGQKPGALEERTDLFPEITRTFVRSGVSVMPPFRKTEISDVELDALAAYLAPQ
jgi:mono/diheme cytochrome c family protein